MLEKSMKLFQWAEIEVNSRLTHREEKWRTCLRC
uniref:Uncharacterized protein n=1 Tax=Lepeophtheirus salmonis TaxID=72036 RepID=A0A0K2UWG4_LEPSM